MSHEWFSVIADRLAEPLLLLSTAGVVLACNPPAIRALGPIEQGRFADHVVDPVGLRRYLTLASRSVTPLPGAVRFSEAATTRWRCDASVAVVGREPFVVLQLRPSSDSARRFLALNEQIAKLQAEIRRRELLERERELLLERERQARAEAEDAALFKDELLASVSHELRTPLHAIAGWLAVIRENPGDHELLARGLEVIERNVDVETQLTEDLVDASFAITGRMTIELQPVDLEAIIRSAVDGVRPAADAKQQRLEVISDVGGCVVNGDPDRLLQIVWNLLSNACKYTPKHGKIQVVLRRVNSHVELAVSDSGDGIAPELLPYVFDRFRRADGSSTRRHGGLGLGLSIVRHLVELHGGVVVAHSEGLGRGATMTVNLPLPMFRRPDAAIEPQPSGGDGQLAGVLTGLRVLLVEDHEDSRELLANILAIRGASLRAVDCSAAAQRVFRRHEFDVVISDIQMPEEDGFTLMRKLRDIEGELDRAPVAAIAVSAHALADARVHALRAGFQAFLAKPLKPAELVAMAVSLSQNRPRTAS